MKNKSSKKEKKESELKKKKEDIVDSAERVKLEESPRYPQLSLSDVFIPWLEKK